MSSSRKLSRERLSQRNFDRAQVGTRVLGALCTVQTELPRGGHHFENFSVHCTNFPALGVRYLILTHFTRNLFADSCGPSIDSRVERHTVQSVREVDKELETI